METILVSWEKLWYGEKPKRNRMWDAVAVHASWNMLSWEMASLVWRVAVGWSLVNFLGNVWVVIDWTETDFKQPALKEQDATCSLSWSSAGFDNYEEKPDVTHWSLVSWLLWNPVWGVSVQQDVTHWHLVQESWSKSCPRRFALFHQKLPPSSTAYLQDSHRHNFSWIWVQKSAPLMKMMMSNKRKMYLWWSSKFNCEWLPTTRGKAVKQIGCLDSWQPTRQGPPAWDYKFFSQMLFMVAKGPGFRQITRQQQHLAFKQCSAKMVGCVSDVAINLCLLAKR